MSYTRETRAKLKEIMEDFLRSRPTYNQVTGKLPYDSERTFDRAFIVHRTDLLESHVPNCTACKGDQSCVTMSALIDLTPDPLTGGVLPLQKFILRHGHGEAGTSRGDLYFAPRVR